MSTGLIALKTLLTKECRRILRIWTQTLVPPAITMILYFLIFGNYLGKHIGTMQGVSYTSFITPGLIMMSTMSSTYGNVVSSFFMGKFQRSIEDILTAPVPTYAILWGFVLGGMFRGLLIAIIVCIIALFFTDLNFTHFFILAYSMLFSLSLLAVLGLINGMLAKKFDDIAIVPTFIITPLTYLGGVFYPINQLSPFWHVVSLFNPIVYMVNLFRYGMLKISDTPVGLSVGILLIFNVVIYIIAYWMLKYGVGVKK